MCEIPLLRSENSETTFPQRPPELMASPPRGCEPLGPGTPAWTGARKVRPEVPPLHPEPLCILRGPFSVPPQSRGGGLGSPLQGRGAGQGSPFLDGSSQPCPREGVPGGVAGQRAGHAGTAPGPWASPAVELPHAVQLRGLGPGQDHLPRQLHDGGQPEGLNPAPLSNRQLPLRPSARPRGFSKGRGPRCQGRVLRAHWPAARGRAGASAVGPPEPLLRALVPPHIGSASPAPLCPWRRAPGSAHAHCGGHLYPRPPPPRL